jgi:hypothetical protein
MKAKAMRLDDAAREKIARVVHEAVRAWQAANGQPPAPPWSRAPKWMKQATLEAIAFRLAHPEAGPDTQHVQWMQEKSAAGWRYGKVKDATKKTHPLMIDYGRLPLVERQKDALVAAVIDSLTGRV